MNEKSSTKLAIDLCKLEHWKKAITLDPIKPELVKLLVRIKCSQK